MINQSISVEEICRKLKPLLGSKVDEIYLRYSLSDSKEEQQEIENILKSLYHKKLNELLSKNILLEPPKQEEVSGEYVLGKVSYANKELYDFALREEDFSRHICISGMSGSGKTTLAFGIIEQLLEKNKPFMVFDWKKSFRPLLPKHEEVVLFSIGNEVIGNYFKININRPPKAVPPKEWITVLTDLISESFSVSYGVHKILLETLDYAYEVNGVYDGSDNYPTWKQLKDYLEHKAEKAKGRESQWIESALRIATVMTFGSFGKIINAKKEKGISIEELLDKKVIFELNSLGNIEKKFFCEFILTYIFKMKKAYDFKKTKNFDHAIIVDEAHNIFLKDKTSFLQESVTDMVYREMREYGTSLICLDQHLSKLSDTVKGNSACHIAFQQQLPQDIFDISDLMQMRPNKEAFSQLPVGSAIVRLSERYPKPFLIRAPYIEREEIITDMEVKERIDSLMTGKLPSKKKIIEETEFFEKIKTPEKIISSKNFTLPTLKPINLPSSILTKTQEILFDYVEKKLAQGVELKEINRVIESHYDRKYYTNTDISKVINLVLEKYMAKLNGKELVHTEEIMPVPKANFKPNLIQENKIEHKSKEKFQSPSNLKISKAEIPITLNQISNLTKEQESFLKFLIENPNHELTTVNFYKNLGLSSRKGNIIKNELLEKDLIIIKEEKNDKGWKKLIRYNIHNSNSSTKHKTHTAISND